MTKLMVAGPLALAVALTATNTASAEPNTDPVKSVQPRLNVAGAVGMNSPTGFAGVEVDYRIHKFFSAGLAGGIGLWGARISPTAKLELQVNRSTGIFLEGALQINTGGEGFTEVNGMRQDFKMDMVPAASFAVGGRVKKWGPFWTGARVGINIPLKKDAYSIVGGGAPTDLTQTTIDLASPGGLVAAWMAGTSF